MYVSNEPFVFPVPLSFQAHELSEQLSRQQPNAKKAKQVYLNTLAVYAVDFYLRCMEVETEAELSDSRNPVFLNFMDVADLQVRSIGKLECRPVLPESKILQIPDEVREGRIGYVAVQFDQSLKQATILGFTPTAVAEIPLAQLRSLDEFPEYLNQCRRYSLNSVLSEVEATVAQHQALLRGWLLNVFEEGWQTLDTFLNRQVAMSTRTVNLNRSQAERPVDSVLFAHACKEIHLNLPNRQIPIVLSMMIVPQQEGENIDIQLRLYPGGDSIYLPPNLQMSVLDQSGAVVSSAQARELDNWLQLKFEGQPSESFGIRVTLGDFMIAESLRI
jgi:Protein of unknown function (DUF1822)